MRLKWQNRLHELLKIQASWQSQDQQVAEFRERFAPGPQIKEQRSKSAAEQNKSGKGLALENQRLSRA